MKKYRLCQISVILSSRQLLFAEDPDRKNREDDGMTKFLNSREMLPQSQFPFVGSDEILNGLFDVINRQVFNANLNGIKLEWCDKLKSRAVIAYELITNTTTQTYIRCSKTWFENRNRQHFVEALLVSETDCKFETNVNFFFSTFVLQYELIQFYIQKNGDDAGKESSPDLLAYLLDAGLSYFNNCYETNIVINNNYKPHNADVKEVQEILASIIVERTPSTGKVTHFTMAPKVKLLTKRITGNKNAVKCDHENGCGSFCYGDGCSSAGALRERYYGSNIYFSFTVDRPVLCFLCENKGKKGTLNAHLNKDCKAFGRRMANIGQAFAF